MLLATVHCCFICINSGILEQVSAGFVAFHAGFQQKLLRLGSIAALLAGFPCNLTGCRALALGPYIIAAALNMIGFSITFGPRAHIAPNVIGFSITFGPHAHVAPNVIGFSITFGPRASAARNVIGFSITFPLCSAFRVHPTCVQ
ncbi:hypothetical protein [Paenibacillus sp. FSL H3-0333]|uniref:hypothetical protein n=1 Tax=Paenibacillus sp. FSL H3-0333 TaxID=2921373 RepID=UPI0030FB47D5